MYAMGWSGSIIRRFLTTCQTVLSLSHHMELTDNQRGWNMSEVYPDWNHAVKRRLADTVKGSPSYERFHGITPHGFRYTFASLLMMNEVSVRDVADLLGHSSMPPNLVIVAV